MIITGIGSRQTPPEILELFEALGDEARDQGDCWIRSGHAEGADYAFEKGARDRCIVYLPWNGFNKDKKVLGIPRTQPLREEVLEIVYRYESYARNLNDPVKLIKSRNVYQILGEDLNTPSDLVVCWTEEGEIEGGTGLAIKIALDYKIPVINVGDYDTQKNFDNILIDLIGNIS